MRDCETEESNSWLCRGYEAPSYWGAHAYQWNNDSELEDASTNVQIPGAGPEVRAFCAQCGITAHVEQAIALAKRVFQPAELPTLTLEQDMETADRYVVINVEASGNSDQVLRANKQYIRGFIAAVPAARRAKIRLSYNVT